MMRLTRSDTAETELFDCFASRQRRAVVAVLSAAPDDLSVRDLAERTAARLDGVAPAAVSDAERERTRVGLHHRDLPKLDSVGLVAHDDEAGRVALADHPALEDPGIRQSLESAGSNQSLDALFEALADDCRQRILSFLSEAHRPIAPRELAAYLAAQDRAASGGEVASAAVDRVQAELHHAQLPKLHEAGLVEYDEADETITFDGHPALRSDWLGSALEHRPADA